MKRVNRLVGFRPVGNGTRGGIVGELGPVGDVSMLENPEVDAFVRMRERNFEDTRRNLPLSLVLAAFAGR